MSHQRDNQRSRVLEVSDEIEIDEGVERPRRIVGKRSRVEDLLDPHHKTTRPGKSPRVGAGYWQAMQASHQRSQRASSAALGPISRKAAGEAVSADAEAAVIEAQRGSGEPLPAGLRAELERDLGADLEAVRLHTGEAAAAAARAVSAQAFALGKDIHFASGAFAPSTRSGRELIAHEVAHTVEAPASSGGGLSISSPGDRHERAADAFASAFVDSGARPAARGRQQPQTAIDPVPAGVIHRQEEDEDDGDGEVSHEDQLREIQAMQMSSLLPAIAALPGDVKTDYEAAHVGGPRLQAAMHAVNDGGDWVSYIDANHGLAGHLPADQLEAIMDYLGGPPTDYGYFKDIGSFDGSLDPNAKVITLYFRVMFEPPENGGVHFPGKPPPGAPGWAEGMKAGLAEFGRTFKQVIESQWSGKGTVKCGVTKLGSFSTVVNVAVVQSNPHSTMTLVTNSVRSNHELGGDHGTLGVNDNQHDDKESLTGPGGKDNPVKTKQTTSSHEFGHAIGVPHPDAYEELRQQYMAEKDPEKKKAIGEQLRAFGYTGDDTYKQELEYGNTEEELNNMMGAGDQLKVVRGEDFFDPFVPFQKIGEAWGAEHIKAKALNKWSTD